MIKSTTKLPSPVPTRVGPTFSPFDLIFGPILWLIKFASQLAPLMPIPVRGVPNEGEAPPDGFRLRAVNFPDGTSIWLTAWSAPPNKWVSEQLEKDDLAEFRGIKGVAETGELYVDAWKEKNGEYERLTDGESRGAYTVELGSTFIYSF